MNFISIIFLVYQVSLSLCINDVFLPKAGSYVFEYGYNYGDQTFVKTGSIGVLEKYLQIPISVPKCSEITYVRVEVENLLGPPKVAYEWNTQMVKISYRPLQYSWSSYQVTAKTVTKPFCREPILFYRNTLA